MLARAAVSRTAEVQAQASSAPTGTFEVAGTGLVLGLVLSPGHFVFFTGLLPARPAPLSARPSNPVRVSAVPASAWRTGPVIYLPFDTMGLVSGNL